MRGSPKRSYVSKGGSARKFRKDVGRTKSVNVKAGPMRGGIRL